MAMLRSYGLKVFRIKQLALILPQVFFMHPAIANMPYPIGSISTTLIEAPTPPALSMYSLPTQQAQVNSNFVFNLKPYIGLSSPQITYRVTNYYQNTATAYLAGVNNEIISVPFGVMQVVNRPGDCPISFPLRGYGEACNLHFNVNPDLYKIGSGSFGPIVSMLISWRWGHRKHQSTAMVSYSPILPLPQRIDELLKPIMLPIKTTVTPATQDGLTYDATTYTLSGKPTRTGVYTFTVSAATAYAKTALRELTINVGIDPHDRPVFKKDFVIPAAMPDKDYRLNLLDLIDESPHLLTHNQVHFAIETNHNYPDWLAIDSTDGTILQGHVPASAAGQDHAITIIATSNTGGDSEPLTINIPIAFDPAKKPVIASGIHLSSTAGSVIRNNFQSKITDPSGDGSLQLVIDVIEPKAPWLGLSKFNALELTGVVPKDAVGQHYLITLHANTATGGNSDSVIIPLDIKVNTALTPRFYSGGGRFPLLTVGQSFQHDFVLSNDIYPEYRDIPYTIELAEGYDNPAWVRIDDNKMLIDSIPDDSRQIEQVFITIKNIPGGKSKVQSLQLVIMN